MGDENYEGVKEKQDDLRNVINASRDKRKRKNSRSRSSSGSGGSDGENERRHRLRRRERRRRVGNRSHSRSSSNSQPPSLKQRKNEEISSSKNSETEDVNANADTNKRTFKDKDKQARYEEFKRNQRIHRDTKQVDKNDHERRRGPDLSRKYYQSSQLSKIGRGHDRGATLRRLPETGAAKSMCSEPCKSIDGYAIFASGLHEETSKEDIEDKFGDFGTVKRLILPRNRKTGMLRGYALIKYEHGADAQDAIDALNKTQMLGQTLNVGWVFIK